MNRNIPAILFFLFFVFIIAHPGATVTGKDIFELKKAGVIELLARAAPDKKDDQPLLRLLSEQREEENRLQNAS